jgi:L-iditol 2-dehydrogenase
MKAAVLYGKEDVRVEDVPERPLQAGEVRIKIEAALTCGTDLKVFKRGYHAKMIVPPAVFGHELAGIVSQTAAEGWNAGERVVVANSAPCGACVFCQRGQENLCDDLLFLNGAYAESIIVPARLVSKNLLRLKPSTNFRDAALVEPLACVVKGVEDARLAAGQNVLLLGSGPIGLLFVALAAHMGCTVMMTGRGERRLKVARQLGAEIVDLSTLKTVPDVVIEAVGKPETWEAAVKAVRKGGTVNFFGGCPSGTTVSLDTAILHYSGLTLVASFHHTPRTIRRALELIEAGAIRATDFVDSECALSALPNLFREMVKGNRGVKTFVRVQE